MIIDWEKPDLDSSPCSKLRTEGINFSSNYWLIGFAFLLSFSLFIDFSTAKGSARKISKYQGKNSKKSVKKKPVRRVYRAAAKRSKTRGAKVAARRRKALKKRNARYSAKRNKASSRPRGRQPAGNKSVITQKINEGDLVSIEIKEVKLAVPDFYEDRALPIAPQSFDGFNGKLLEAFAPQRKGKGIFKNRFNKSRYKLTRQNKSKGKGRYKKKRRPAARLKSKSRLSKVRKRRLPTRNRKKR